MVTGNNAWLSKSAHLCFIFSVKKCIKIVCVCVFMYVSSYECVNVFYLELKMNSETLGSKGVNRNKSRFVNCTNDDRPVYPITR